MRRLPLILLIAAFLNIVPACSEEKHEYVANAGERTPTMRTTDVNTFVSDSGYTRYKIVTPLWVMYEDAEDPYWHFPNGLHLQQFDKEMNPEASIDCDSARFFSARGLWQLDGHVVAVNTLRDSFLTNQLFWNRTSRKVYSDSFVHIVRTDHILEGYGFESDEQMNAYNLKRPTGIIPVERNQFGTSAATASQADSSADAPARTTPGRRRAPAAQ
ncbi:MAG: LPS export ABC transporter periplasmic protein LptC [Muribaculaceae bacterium]|nr:LPS export ABC transporter periplasmic protein LptC [Muribaculaceae bacterium]